MIFHVTPNQPKEGVRLAPLAKGCSSESGINGFITDRDGETLELEADHRRHAEIENAIRDLKSASG